MNKKAFTLAEVLITLGVIGIVAALTMPALIANYQKKVLEARIKKFYSVINQTVNTKIADDGGLDYSMITAFDDADDAEAFFNANYAPYMKTVGFKKLTKGVAVGFPDGSGMYLFSRSVSSGGFTTALTWCVDYKKCTEIDESKPGGPGSTSSIRITDGKSTFFFKGDGATDLAYYNNLFAGSDVRENVKTNCAGGVNLAYCSGLLQLDNWGIKDDYPW